MRPGPVEREEVLGQLARIAENLDSELDLDALLDRILEACRFLTGARWAAIAVLEDGEADGGSERLVTSGDPPDASTPALPATRELAAPARADGLLSVPVLIDGELYGALHLSDKRDGAFGDRDEQAVVTLAAWAAVSLAHSRLYALEHRRRDELERAARRYEGIAEVSRAVGREERLDEVLQVIATRAAAVVAGDAAAILLVDGDELIVAAVAGRIAPEEVGRRLGDGETLGGDVLRAGRSRLVTGAAAIERPRLAGAEGPRAALLAPLLFRGTAVGVLEVLDHGDDAPGFAEDDVALLESFASAAAVAVGDAQRVEAELLRRSVNAADEERRRWARELHDQTLQDLGGVMLLVESALHERHDERRGELMDRARERVTDAIRDLRDLIAELRPRALDELGLEPALHGLAERVAALHGVQVDTAVTLASAPGRPPTRLVPAVEQAVYRLVQEALANVAQHAGATHVAVTVGERHGHVDVVVADNGRGFPVGATGRGFGLIGMRERLAALDGQLSIESGADGTRLTARLPARHLPGA